MKTTILAILVFMIACTKQQTCTEANGTWKLSKVIKDGNVFCTYNKDFYYQYEFTDNKVIVIQYRNDVDSFCRSGIIECSNVWMVSQDSFRYGNFNEYLVMVKEI